MRWVCRSVTALALLAALASGCGSTASDRLVFRFLNWDSTGLNQADSVRPASADVDVVPQLVCLSGGTAMSEPFTQTIINAVFQNEEASDIRLEGYVVHFNDGRFGVGDGGGSTTADIIGGRCTNNSDKQCADDTDCSLVGITGTCAHSQTTVSGLVLVDFAAKAAVQSHPELWYVATSLTVTFFGSDPNQSFETSAGYVVTFGDFDNCMTTTGTGGA